MDSEEVKGQFVLLTVRNGTGRLYIWERKQWDFYLLRSIRPLYPMIEYEMIVESDDLAYLKNLQQLTNQPLDD